MPSYIVHSYGGRGISSTDTIRGARSYISTSSSPASQPDSLSKTAYASRLERRPARLAPLRIESRLMGTMRAEVLNPTHLSQLPMQAPSVMTISGLD